MERILFFLIFSSTLPDAILAALTYQTSHPMIPLHSKFNITMTCVECVVGSYIWEVGKMSSSGGYHPYSLGVLTNGPVLEILPFTLEPGTELAFRVTAKVGSNEVSSKIEMKANYPPYDGYCNITPNNGTVRMTNFNLTCEQWKDELTRTERNERMDNDEGITYRVYENITIEEKYMVFYNTEDIPYKFNLTKPGQAENNYTTNITIRVMDILLDYVELNVSLEVFPIGSGGGAAAVAGSVYIHHMTPIITLKSQAVQLNLKKVKTVEYLINPNPKAWTYGLYDVPNTCEDAYSFQDLIKNVMDRSVDPVLESVLKSMEVTARQILAYLPKLMRNPDDLKIAVDAYATVMSDPLRVSNNTMAIVAEAYVFLSEKFVNYVHQIFILDTKITNTSCANISNITNYKTTKIEVFNVTCLKTTCCVNSNGQPDGIQSETGETNTTTTPATYRNTSEIPSEAETTENTDTGETNRKRREVPSEVNNTETTETPEPSTMVNTPHCTAIFPDATCLTSNVYGQYSFEYLSELFESMLYLSSKMINALEPGYPPDMYEPLVCNSIDEARDVIDFIIRLNQPLSYTLMDCAKLTPEERIGIFYLQSKVYQLLFQKQQLVVNKNIFTTIEEAVKLMTYHMLNRTCMGCSSQVSSKLMNVLFAKTNTSFIMNKQFKVDNVALSVDVTGQETDLFVQVSVLKKNLWIAALSSSLVSSYIANVKFINSSVGDAQFEIVTVSLPTPNEISSTVYPEFIPEDVSRCHYHMMSYQAEGEHLCVFINFLENNSINAYDIYMRQGRFPTLYRFEYQSTVSPANNWTTCLKPKFTAGPVYFCFHPVVSKTNDTSIERTPFNLTLATVSCWVLNKENETWSRNEQCKMNWYPTKNEVQCTCPEVGDDVTVGHSFYVPPNSISFSTVFLKFKASDQAAIIGALAAVAVLYTVLCIWARLKDKEDVLKWGVTPLVDNNYDDENFYLLTVYTGMRIGAGSNLSVEFIIAGSESDTGARRLYDGVREVFKRGSTFYFLMTTDSHLGDLDYIHVWIDQENIRTIDPWYLHRIDVEDLQKRYRYVFLCNRWLANEDKQGSFQSVIPVSGKEDVLAFSNLFYYNIKEHLTDNHMFTSVFLRPTRSSFTRVQRLTCLLVFSVMTMISNAIYFRPEDQYEDPEKYKLGPFVITLQTIYVSVVSALVSATTVFLVVFLFRKSKGQDKYYNPAKEKDKASKYIFSGDEIKVQGYLQNSRELERIIIRAKGIDDSNGEILPHWCKYIAWILAIVGSLAAMFFLFLYSMEWGKQKTEMWLTQFYMSFSISSVILDQVKMLVLAALFSLIFVPKKKFSPSDVTIPDLMKGYKLQHSEFSADLRQKAWPPLSSQERKEAFDDHKRRGELWGFIKDALIVCVFLVLVATISYGNRDNKSFLIHDNLYNHFVRPAFGINFKEIITTTDFKNWMKTVAFPALFPEKDHKGETLHWHWRQYFADLSNYRVGPPRLRQLRVNQDTKYYPFVGKSRVYPEYNIYDEITDKYCIGWTSPPCDVTEITYSYSSNAWKFTSSADVWGLPIPGIYSTYGGGGYIAEMDINLNVSESLLDELFTKRWIDRNTRAVSLEFTLYSPDANIFTYANFLAEFPETGGILKVCSIYPLRIYQHHGSNGLFILICEILFLGCVAIIAIRVVFDFHSFGCLYFESVQRTLNLAILVVCGFGIVVYFARLVFAIITMNKFTEDPKKFLNFYHIVLVDYIFVVALSFLIFLITLKLIMILECIKNVERMTKTVAKCLQDLGYFALVFWYILIGYGVLGFLFFGDRTESFRDVFTSVQTLTIYVISTSNYTELNRMHPVLAKLYFFFYVLMQCYFLLTIFLAILCSCIDVVAKTITRSKGLDVLELLNEYFSGMFPWNKKSPKKNPKKQQDTMDLMTDLAGFCRNEIGTIKK